MRGKDEVRIPRARELRRAMTQAEAKLWRKLRDRGLSGLKFTRQQPAGPFVIDFCCREKMLAVEVDGATHSADAEIARDKRREAFLKRQGYAVIRFSNDQVCCELPSVLDTILARAGLPF